MLQSYQRHMAADKGSKPLFVPGVLLRGTWGFSRISSIGDLQVVENQIVFINGEGRGMEISERLHTFDAYLTSNQHYMKKNVFLIPVIVFFMSCQPASFTEAQRAKIESELLGELFNQNGTSEDFEGGVVRFDAADSCLKKYQKEILSHGFDSFPTIQPTEFRIPIKIVTHSVRFRGDGLGDWISKIRNLTRDSVDFRIELGMYTPEYVNEYLKKDPTMIGRISTFIIPYKKGTTIVIKELPPDDDKVYNLGGLQP